jgi:saccharopine dehydrogenase-like NADP-dependent oxidoreductase
MNSLIWTKGHWERKEPVTVQEEWEFPKPVGKLKVTLVDHEETQTLPRFIGKGCKEMSFMLHLGDDWLNIVKALRTVGLVDRKPISVGGVKVVPRDVVVACVSSPVDPEIQSKTKGNTCVGSAVIGWKGDKKYMHYIWNTMSHAKCWETYRSTATPTQVAVPTAIAATLFAQGKIKERGVFPPEVLNARMMMNAFSKYGFKWDQMTKKLN